MSYINPVTIIVLAALVGVLGALIYARRKSASSDTTDDVDDTPTAGRVTAQGAGGTGPFRPKNGTQ